MTDPWSCVLNRSARPSDKRTVTFTSDRARRTRDWARRRAPVLVVVVLLGITSATGAATSLGPSRPTLAPSRSADRAHVGILTDVTDFPLIGVLGVSGSYFSEEAAAGIALPSNP